MQGGRRADPHLVERLADLDGEIGIDKAALCDKGPQRALHLADGRPEHRDRVGREEDVPRRRQPRQKLGHASLRVCSRFERWIDPRGIGVLHWAEREQLSEGRRQARPGRVGAGAVLLEERREAGLDARAVEVSPQVVVVRRLPQEDQPGAGVRIELAPPAGVGSIGQRRCCGPIFYTWPRVLTVECALHGGSRVGLRRRRDGRDEGEREHHSEQRRRLRGCFSGWPAWGALPADDNCLPARPKNTRVGLEVINRLERWPSTRSPHAPPHRAAAPSRAAGPAHLGCRPAQAGNPPRCWLPSRVVLGSENISSTLVR